MKNGGNLNNDIFHEYKRRTQTKENMKYEVKDARQQNVMCDACVCVSVFVY